MATKFTMTVTFSANEKHNDLDTSSLDAEVRALIRDQFATNGSELYGFEQVSATIKNSSVRVRITRNP